MNYSLLIFSAFFGLFVIVWAFFALLKRNDDDADDDLGYLEHIDDI